jgi:transcriptional regulator with XRE-family HTH domain
VTTASLNELFYKRRELGFKQTELARVMHYAVSTVSVAEHRGVASAEFEESYRKELEVLKARYGVEEAPEPLVGPDTRKQIEFMWLFMELTPLTIARKMGLDRRTVMKVLMEMRRIS